MTPDLVGILNACIVHYYSFGVSGILVISFKEEWFEARFSNLLFSVQTSLEGNNAIINRLRQFLVDILQCEECLPKDTFTINNLLTAVTMNGLWDFQHYSPLEQLTDYFLSDDLKIKNFVSDYKHQLAKLFHTTKLVDYIKYKQLEVESGNDSHKQFTSRNYAREHYRKIRVRRELVQDLSLDYVIQLWCSIAEEYKVPSQTAIIDNIIIIAEFKLEIIWLLPSHTASMIKPRAKLFKKFHITQVFIDDTIIYDEEEMVGIMT